MANEPIILFDGACNLCDRTIRFIVRRDTRACCRLASLHSEAARRLLEPLGIHPASLGSVVLLADGRVHTKSEAALRIAGYLTGPWKFFGVLRLVPRPLRDWAYDLVTRNRHRWFGRKRQCELPTSELRGRFLT